MLGDLIQSVNQDNVPQWFPVYCDLQADALLYAVKIVQYNSDFVCLH